MSPYHLIFSVSVDGETVENLFRIRDDSLLLATDASNLSDSPYVLSIEVSDLAGASFVESLPFRSYLLFLHRLRSACLRSSFATLSTTDLNADVSYSLVSGDSLLIITCLLLLAISCMLISIPIMSSVMITPFVSGLPI